MKTKVALLFFALIISTTSCEDLLTVTLDAEFNSAINTESTGQQVEALALKSTSSDYTFSGDNIVSLSDDEDIVDYIEKIKSINIVAIECEIFGIPAEEKIENLKIMIDGTSFFPQYFNVTADNNTITVLVESEVLDEVETYFEENHMLKTMISGSTTAPMSLVVNIKYVTKIKADPL